MQLTEWMHPFFDRKTQKQGKSEDLPCRYIWLHYHAENLLAEEIPERNERGIPHRDARRRPADEPLDRHPEQSGRDGNNGADTRDHADDRQSAPLITIPSNSARQNCAAAKFEIQFSQQSVLPIHNLPPCYENL